MPHSCGPCATAVSVLVCCITVAPDVATAQVQPTQPVAAIPAVRTELGPVPSFRDLFTDAIADFRQVPSRQTLTIVSIGGIAALAAQSADRPATRALSHSAGMGEIFSAGETLGGARFQMAGAIATYTLGRAISQPAVARIGADLVRAQIVTQAMTASIKLAVGRDRPDGTEYSFPSGHTSTAFATATVLQRNLGWKAGIPAYGLASYIAASRIQVRRHYLSDVTFGAAIGIVAGRAVTIGRGGARFALSPAAHPGGAGVRFTWIGRP